MATATNPITDSGLIATIRAKGISTSDITDDNLLVVIEDALNEYLFFRPKVCITSSSTCLTTVADQPNYNKPTAALWIRNVLWNPQYSTDELEDLWQEILLSNVYELDASMLMLDYGKMARLHRLFAGSWSWLNDQIWLKPTPQTSGEKVAVIYADDRTLDELDEIADHRFVDLCLYNAMYAVGVKKTTGGGWRAGQYTLDARVGEQTIRAAEKGLERIRAQIANAYSGSRS